MAQDPKNNGEETVKLPDILPVLPLKDVVIFPYVIVPLSIGSDRTAQAVDFALADERLVMLVAQHDPEVDDPGPSELYDVGTAGLIMRMLKLPDGRLRILVQGLARARIERISRSEPFLQARISAIDEAPVPAEDLSIDALVRDTKENLEQALHLGKSLSPEVMVIAANLDDPGRLADLAASNLELKAEDAQKVLETEDPIERLQRVNALLHRELQLLTMQHEISNQAREEIDRSQREYFLRQQLRTIQSELGDSDDFAAEIEGYRKAAEEKGMSEEGVEELEKQIRRLERSHPDSAETTVIRTYLDWLTGLPWTEVSEDTLELDHAREILDRDHYGLEKIKERILEFLAVRQLKADTKGPILCFIGPPGVGKTSLGRSIAQALGRQFVRLSLGGVRDEAEIRGHRRTYVGAMPGRIIQGISQAGTNNPVFMLDEIDKIGSDFRGDPSSALLEALDPEQNGTFRDHYLGISYDLSKVIFITTGNLTDPIQPAFLDRMEVLRLSGYTLEDKLEIAKHYLIPKQIAENGLSGEYLRFSQPGVRKLIEGYTREAGLRNLEREIASVCRKVAVRVAGGKSSKVTVGPKRIEGFLGPEKHFREALLDHDRVGIATGLAWTATGGDLLFIEVVAVPGKGELSLTGQLGEVMKESGQTALSFARDFAARRSFDSSFFSENDFHIHAPAGAIPKDGPSAGITIAAAILSVLTEIPIKSRVAMTGELTLRGEVLPIGGLKEKALAARAAGVETLIIPELNQRDIAELPRDLKRALDIHPIATMDQVLELALTAPIEKPHRIKKRGKKAG